MTQVQHGSSAFSLYKEELIGIVQAEILKTLEEMGEDVQGIEWFSSSAPEYNSSRFLKAA